MFEYRSHSLCICCMYFDKDIKAFLFRFSIELLQLLRLKYFSN
ncbi:hypothetical protein CGLO_18243 [Colletotrichum gloeosporioides Cg-14]|uniref:Uncharacterized protein n=1 Tax=Colletotrichum gloeosporioides (strain Cg-14) TaxID=1237896 RepID=T0JUW7_COLGC|nr:hypothetical protein CGLO_18243 [Colletotrichum gloeosporioides Cg-14]